MIKRVFSLPPSEARKIRARQLRGSMSIVHDKESYLCYYVDEYENWKPKKRGRKPKIEK